MMKIALNRDEKGQALILVLILLLLASIIIASLLGFMGTGLKAGQVFESKMHQLYAADAGIEDAICKIVTPDALLPSDVGDEYAVSYPIANVNNKHVAVEISKVYEWKYEGTSEEFLKGLTEHEHISHAEHSDWFHVSTDITTDPESGNRKYIITITYQEWAEDPGKPLWKLGAWLAWPEGGTNYWGYVDKSASGITDDYLAKRLEVNPYKGGTAFTWIWATPNPDWPTFDPGDTKTQTFEFTPVEDPVFHVEDPVFHFAWVKPVPEDIYISTSLGEFTIWKVTATASSTDKQTEVIAYVSREGDEGAYAVEILTWEIK